MAANLDGRGDLQVNGAKTLFKLCWKVVSRDESGACETSWKTAEGTKIFFFEDLSRNGCSRVKKKLASSVVDYRKIKDCRG